MNMPVSMLHSALAVLYGSNIRLRRSWREIIYDTVTLHHTLTIFRMNIQQSTELVGQEFPPFSLYWLNFALEMNYLKNLT